MLVNKASSIRIKKGKELKTPRHASAAASRDGRLPHSRQYISRLDKSIIDLILYLENIGYFSIF
jgi:hypothetical protein